MERMYLRKGCGSSLKCILLLNDILRPHHWTHACTRIPVCWLTQLSRTCCSVTSPSAWKLHTCGLSFFLSWSVWPAVLLPVWDAFVLCLLSRFLSVLELSVPSIIEAVVSAVLNTVGNNGRHAGCYRRRDAGPQEQLIMTCVCSPCAVATSPSSHKLRSCGSFRCMPLSKMGWDDCRSERILLNELELQSVFVATVLWSPWELFTHHQVCSSRSLVAFSIWMDWYAVRRMNYWGSNCQPVNCRVDFGFCLFVLKDESDGNHGRGWRHSSAFVREAWEETACVTFVLSAVTCDQMKAVMFMETQWLLVFPSSLRSNITSDFNVT